MNHFICGSKEKGVKMNIQTWSLFDHVSEDSKKEKGKLHHGRKSRELPARDAQLKSA